MRTFSVIVAADVRAYATVDVEATDADEARRLVHEYGAAEFVFDHEMRFEEEWDTLDGAEVVDVMELDCEPTRRRHNCEGVGPHDTSDLRG